MSGRIRIVNLTLLTVVLLWALTAVGARYAVTHGFEPIAFAAFRQIGSTAIIAGICVVREGSLTLPRNTFAVAALAMAFGLANQVFFMYAIQGTTASTVGLVLGTTPIITMLFAALLRIELLSLRGIAAAAVSFLGVALVSCGIGEIGGGLWGYSSLS